MKAHLKKIVFPAALVLGLSFLLVQPAHAGWLMDVAAGPMVGWILYIVIFSISWIAGVAISILGWGISTILEIGLQIVNSPPVQAGFPVTLAIANLGFVLGIIIIAVATILRNPTYGIKTFLYKVVLMAVLVNFGLVLAGGVINVSDNFTKYFLDSITGGKDPSGFAEKMVAAFEPQEGWIVKSEDASSSATANAIKNSGDNLSALLRPIATLLMTLVSLVMTVITLAAFFVMLLIRYVTLVLLLILLPLAWMAWVFPGLSKWFSQWWDSFIQQILFPPVVLFFLWIAIRTFGQTYKFPLPGGGSLGKTVTDLGGSALAQGMASVMHVVVLSFMMAGGLIVAQKLGVAFADTGMKWAQGAKDKVLGKVGREAAGVGGSVLRTAPLRALSTGLQKVGAGTGIGSRLLRATGVGFLAGQAGRGLDAGARGGEKNYKYYADMASKLNKEQLMNRVPQAKGAELAAILAKAQKEGWAQDVAGVIPTAELKKRLGDEENWKENWKGYGDKKAGDDVTAAIGSQEMREAQDEMRSAKDAGALDVATKKFAKAADAFIKNMNKDAAAKFEWKSVLRDKDSRGNPKSQADLDAQSTIIQSLADNKPDFIGSINSKLSGKEKENLVTQAYEYYDNTLTQAQVRGDAVTVARMQSGKDKMEKSMGAIAELAATIAAATAAASKAAAAPAPATGGKTP